MKMRALIFFFLGFVLLAPAQVSTFKILYGGGLQDEARFVEPLPDGSFLVAGQTGTNALLVRFHADGTEQWSRTFGGAGTNLFTRLLACSDGNFIALGETTSTGAGNVDFLVVKFDPAGNVLWQRTAGGSNEETARGICELADGYVISGGTRSFGAGFWDIFVEKIDFNGNTLWTRAWGNGGGDIAGEVLPAPNNEIWVSGFVFVVSNNHDANLFRLSSSGDLLSSTRYAIPDNNGFGSVDAGGPGFLAGGGTWFNNVHNPMLMGFSSDGTLSWARRYLVPGGNFEAHIESTPDGGGMFAAHNISNDTQDAILVRVNGTGDVVWARAHSFEGTGRILHMRATPDGGFIAVGYAQSGSRQVFIVKTDGDGRVELCCPNDASVTAINLSSGTVAFTPEEASGPANAAASLPNAAAGFPVADICDGPCCTPPEVFIAAPTGITCSKPSITLDATNSSQGPNFNLQWSGPGIVSGQNSPQPVVNQAGTYTLTITNTLTGCSEEASVQVPDLTQNPVVVVTAPSVITCTLPTASVSGAGSSSGPGFSYEWSTADGNILSGANQINATVDQPGTYTLTVTNQATGCVSEASVTVLENTTPPAAVAGPALQLGCSSPQGQLNGTGSATGAGILYAWSPNPASGGNTLTPTVNQPGTYTLTVLNSNNGCSASSQTSVTSNFELPLVLIAEPPSISCLSPEVQLDASASSSGPEFIYSWTSPNGLLLSGANTPTPIAGAPGSYLLQILNQANGCLAAAAVLVTGSTDSPSVSIAPAQEITCGQPSITLEGSILTANEHLVFFWTANPGNIVSGQESLTPIVNAGGSYQLLATDTLNGCTDTVSVQVLQNGNIPIISLATPDELNCQQSSVLVDAGASTLYPGVSIQWQTVNGNILSGAETLEILVDAPGAYTLTLQDTLNQCTVSQSVQVDIDTLAPVLSMGSGGVLNCVDTVLTLTAGIDTQGSPASWQWSTLDGQINSAVDQLEIIVSAGGWYVLEVWNNGNGCTGQDSVLVGLDQQIPLAEAGEGGTINCLNSSIQLDASASSSGPELVYVWSGGPLQGDSTLTPITTQAGVYQISVLNTQNQCVQTDTVVVLEDLESPLADAGPVLELSCNEPEINLLGSGSQGAEYEYTWSGPGLLSGAQSLTPLVNAPGIYTLTVLNQENGCSATAQTEVLGDGDLPQITLGPAAPITCAQPQVTLDATGSSSESFIVYQWSSADGQILGDANSPLALVNAPGPYTLTLQNTLNQCTASQSVQVEIDTLAPVLSMGSDGVLNCVDTVLTLTAGIDAQGGPVSWQWSTLEGQINSPADQLEIIVSAGGWYVLEVWNDGNGCIAQDSVLVMLDQQIPLAEAGEGGTINCLNSSIQLDASASSSGPELVYVWSGGPLQGDSTQTPIVTQAGIYQISVLNTQNQCVQTDTVVVLEDLESPQADAGPVVELNCNEPEINLLGSGSQGAEYEYTWSGPGLLSGAQSLMPLVNAPGIYTLTVLNQENGCSATAQTEVQGDAIPPQISLDSSALLTCAQPQVQLDATGSSSESFIVYQWSSADGQILGGANSPLALVNAPGTYTLTLQNTLNQCTASQSVQVYIDTLAPVLSMGSGGVLNCVDTVLTLTAGIDAQGGPVSWQWSTLDGQINSPADQLEIIVSAGGWYVLEVWNTDNGCSVSGAIEVVQDDEAPVLLIATPDTLTCIRETVLLAASATPTGALLTTTWNTQDGNILTGANTLSPEVTEPGLYTLTVTNPGNACVTTESVVVVQNTELPMADAGLGFIWPCDQMEVYLSGSYSNAGPSPQISWQSPGGALLTGSNTLTPAIGAGGLYILTVLNTDNGCEASDQVEVLEAYPEMPVWSLQQPSCPGDFGTLQLGVPVGGTPPYAYSLDGGLSYQLSPEFGALSPGVYTLVVQDALGCEQAETLYVWESPGVVLSLEATVTLPLGDSVQLLPQLNVPETDIALVQWSPAQGLSCVDCLRPWASPQGSTVYLLELTTVSGCSAEARVQVFVDTNTPVYVPNVFSPNGDGFNDVFTLFAREGSLREVRSLRVFSRWGETVFERTRFQPNDLTQGWDGSHRGQPLNPAVFVWMAELEFLDGRVEVLKGDLSLVR